MSMPGSRLIAFVVCMWLAAFAAANPGRIEEVDVNPLLVTATGAVAVDALIRMRPA